MIEKIKHINEIIKRLKIFDVAEIQYIEYLDNDTLFYDFIREKHIDIIKLLSLHERIEEHHLIPDNTQSRIKE